MHVRACLLMCVGAIGSCADVQGVTVQGDVCRRKTTYVYAYASTFLTVSCSSPSFRMHRRHKDCPIGVSGHVAVVVQTGVEKKMRPQRRQRQRRATTASKPSAALKMKITATKTTSTTVTSSKADTNGRAEQVRGKKNPQHTEGMVALLDNNDKHAVEWSVSRRHTTESGTTTRTQTSK